MSQRWIAFAAAVATFAGGVAEAAVSVTVAPRTIVLGRSRGTATIAVRGFTGGGPVGVAVNVGAVKLVRARGDEVTVVLRLPRTRFPQWLCLLLWRRGGRALVVRAPLHGRTLVPIRTRARSQVTLEIAGRVFGPQTSDARGRLKMAVMVPPGVTTGHVEVVDRAGLRRRKTVTIVRPPYKLLSVGVRRAPGSSAREPRFEVMIASAEAKRQPPLLRAIDGKGQTIAVPVRSVSPGRWRARWKAPHPGKWRLVASFGGASRSAAGAAEVDVAAPAVRVVKRRPPITPPPRVRRSVEPPAPRGLRWTAGLSAGVLHNLGALVSPRLTLDLGASYPLPVGRIGARVGAGMSWANQDIVLNAAESTTSRVWLVPLAATVTYSLSWGRLSPFAGAGVVAQIVRSSSDGALSGSELSTDVAIGGRWLLGLGVAIGPGELFAQAGYQYARLDSDAVELLAGGLLFDFGFRLRLAK